MSHEATGEPVGMVVSGFTQVIENTGSERMVVECIYIQYIYIYFYTHILCNSIHIIWYDIYIYTVYMYIYICK